MPLEVSLVRAGYDSAHRFFANMREGLDDEEYREVIALLYSDLEREIMAPGTGFIMPVVPDDTGEVS